MSSEASHLQFSPQIWQAVDGQARRCLLRREFCAEQSRIENLRCVHFEEEIDCCYGRQLWYFEAIGVDPIGRRHMLYGALDFSIQYGLLEPSQAALFEDADHRQRFLHAATQPLRQRAWEHPSTKFWVRTAIAACVTISLIAVFLCLVTNR